MSIHALVLYPTDPEYIPDAGFVVFLKNCGFLGQAYSWYYGESGYYAGHGFFDFIEFESSHSVIRLIPTPEGIVESEPEDSRKSCKIQLKSDEKAMLHLGCNFKYPLCPKCKNIVSEDEFNQIIEVWFTSRKPCFCSLCGNSFSACDLDYQYKAGLSRYWIDIEQIHEGEAKPTTDFLHLLKSATSREWRYFWYHL
jgi:hypothetical protein